MIFTLREGAHRATLPVEKANIDPWNLAGPKSDYKVIIPQLNRFQALETLHGKEKANKTVVQIAAIYEADTDFPCIFSRKRG